MRVLRQSLLTVIKGPLAAILVLFWLVILVPFLMLMEWLEEGRASPRLLLAEAFEPWHEFVDDVRGVRP